MVVVVVVELLTTVVAVVVDLLTTVVEMEAKMVLLADC